MRKNLTGYLFMISLLLYLPLQAQVLETEDARPLLPGQSELGIGVEFQTSSEGTETALPLAFEYGITKRFTALIEPVAFTNISPKIGDHATGFGDLELTLFFNAVKERKYIPSVSVSGEIKLPTTQNTLIGTGKTDFTPYLIASKKIGKFDISMNLSYTFLGKPAGIDINNVFGYALGSIYKINESWILFAEVYGNSSATGEGEVPEGQISTDSTILIPEISGGEMVGAVGFGFYVNKRTLLSLGINYDNNNAVLIRPGVEWKFGGAKKVM